VNRFDIWSAISDKDNHVLESANWKCSNNHSSLNSNKSVFLDGIFAFWSSVAVLGSFPSSETKMLNFSSSIMEVMLDVTFFLVDPVSECWELHESSIFGTILDSFCTVFFDSSGALGIRVAPSETMPGTDTKTLPVDFVEITFDLVFSVVGPVSEWIEVLETMIYTICGICTISATCISRIDTFEVITISALIRIGTGWLVC